VLEAQGRCREAAAILRTAIHHATRACGEDSLAVATSLNDFGVCCKSLARFAEAGQSYQRALDIFERRVGHDDPRVATVYHNLGGLEHAAGNWLRGEAFAREAVRIRTRALGKSHPDVAADLAALAALLDQQKKYDLAESLYRRALAIQTRANGPDHPSLFASLNNLAALYQATRRPRLAEALYRRALEIETATAIAPHPKVAFCRSNLAALLLARGRLAEAERLSRLALATLRRQLGPRHPTTAICLKNYAAILKRIGHPRKAARLGQRAAHILNAIDAVNDEGIAVTATINPLRTRYRLMVRTSPVHRFGVYTKEPIPAGHRVIEYTGEKIARAEAKRRWDPVRSYLFELDSYWRLDGAVGGSGAEYINHSCVPNLVTRQRGHRIFYFSKRRIATGEELTVDYKYAADLPPMACRCLAPDCRGTMNRLNLPRPKSLTATGRVSDTG
jgi:tetratricopeptide (TPR) repeat protein